MPFYELICIAKGGIKAPDLRDLVRKTTVDILKSGGVVRGLQNWGERTLPQRIKKHQIYHYEGHYWMMHFDSNAAMLAGLSKTMNFDQRIIKFSFFKLGDKLENIVQRPDKSKLR